MTTRKPILRGRTATPHRHTYHTVYVRIYTPASDLFSSQLRKDSHSGEEKTLSTSLDFRSTYEMMPPVCKLEPRNPLSLFLCCRHAGSAATRKVVGTPEGPVIRMSVGKGNPSDGTQVRFALTESRDSRLKRSPLSYFPVGDQYDMKKREKEAAPTCLASNLVRP
jgi:hypothetical protein